MKDENIYIGSTIQDLKKRMYTHKKDSKTKNNKLYNYIRESGGIQNLNILTVEKITVGNKKDLLTSVIGGATGIDLSPLEEIKDSAQQVTETVDKTKNVTEQVIKKKKKR
jgi:ferritin